MNENNLGIPSSASSPEGSGSSWVVGESASSDAVREASSEVGQSTVGPPTDFQASAQERIPAPNAAFVSRVAAVDPNQAASLTSAIDLLRESVQELISKDRRTTAAAVSLQMRKSTGNTFSPTIIGFDGFRKFLYFAEKVGAVTLTPAVAGGDVEVFPATVASPSSTAEPDHETQFVRRDFWQAFIDWSPKWCRVFDVKTNQIIRRPTLSDEKQDADSRLWAVDPDRYRRIIPLTEDDQIAWMRDFVDQLRERPESYTLEKALQGDRPIASFVETINQMPGLQRAWRQTLSRRVTSRITDWLREEQLDIDIYQLPFKPKSRTSGADAVSPREPKNILRSGITSVHQGAPSEELRRQVLEAVARMPLTELLRLPIPAEYLLRQ